MSDQKSYSFEFKMEVLREIEERKGEKNSNLAIAKKYSIPASTLATFLKNYNKTAVLEAEPMDIMGIIKNIKCLLYSQELFLLNSQILNKKNDKKKTIFGEFTHLLGRPNSEPEKNFGVPITLIYTGALKHLYITIYCIPIYHWHTYITSGSHAQCAHAHTHILSHVRRV